MKHLTQILAFSLSAWLICFSAPPAAHSQIYNNRYFDANSSNTFFPRGKSITDAGTRTVVANSMYNPANSSYDFYIAYIDNSGNMLVEYYFGSSAGDEFLNGIVHYEDDRYFLYGQSSNGNMLTMLVDLSGNVFWSEEIIFNSTSSAITALLVPATGDFVVFGDIFYGSDTEVGSFAISSAGVLQWALEYNMNSATSSNSVKDMNFAGALGPVNFAKLAVVGNHDDGSGQGKVFALGVYSSNGEPYIGSIYEDASGLNITGPEVVNAEDLSEDIIITFGQSRVAGSGAPPLDMTAIKTNIYSLSTITNQNAYQLPQMIRFQNRDLIRTGTDFVLLANEFQSPYSNFNPVFLKIDAGLNFNNATYSDIGLGRVPFALENINNDQNSNDFIINANYTNQVSPFNTGINVMRFDGSPFDCTMDEVWDQIGSNIVTTPFDITADIFNTQVSYPITGVAVDLIYTLDCNDMFLVPIAQDDELDNNGQQLAGINENNLQDDWLVYPNPTEEVVNIQLPNSDSPIQVTIYDLTGKVVKQISTNQSLTTVSVGDLPNGSYLIRMIGSFGTRETSLVKV